MNCSDFCWASFRVSLGKSSRTCVVWWSSRLPPTLIQSWWYGCRIGSGTLYGRLSIVILGKWAWFGLGVRFLRGPQWGRSDVLGRILPAPLWTGFREHTLLAKNNLILVNTSFINTKLVNSLDNIADNSYERLFVFCTTLIPHALWLTQDRICNSWLLFIHLLIIFAQRK